MPDSVYSPTTGPNLLFQMRAFLEFPWLQAGVVGGTRISGEEAVEDGDGGEGSSNAVIIRVSTGVFFFAKSN
jgi:hypothetical protein